MESSVCDVVGYYMFYSCTRQIRHNPGYKLNLQTPPHFPPIIIVNLLLATRNPGKFWSSDNYFLKLKYFSSSNLHNPWVISHIRIYGELELHHWNGKTRQCRLETSHPSVQNTLSALTRNQSDVTMSQIPTIYLRFVGKHTILRKSWFRVDQVSMDLGEGENMWQKKSAEVKFIFIFKTCGNVDGGKVCFPRRRHSPYNCWIGSIESENPLSIVWTFPGKLSFTCTIFTFLNFLQLFLRSRCRHTFAFLG